MQMIELLLCVIQLYVFYIEKLDGIEVHEEPTEVATTELPILLTSTIDPKIENNSTELTNSTEAIISNDKTTFNTVSYPNEYPTSTAMPNKTVETNLKLMSRHGSFSNFHTFPHKVIKMYKPTRDFVPSPELNVDSSHPSTIHDEFVPIDQVNPVSFNEHTIPAVHSPILSPVTHQNHELHTGKLPWSFPYEINEKHYKWKVLVPHSNVESDSKLLPVDQSESLGAHQYPTKTISTHPYVYDIPNSLTNTHQTPFSYTTIDNFNQAGYAEPTSTFRFPTQEIHTETYSTDEPQRPTIPDYYTKVLENYHQPNNNNVHAHDHGHTDVLHINTNVLWHSVLKFLATAVPIGLVISALSPDVVTVNANSTSRYPFNGQSPPPTPQLPLPSSSVSSKTYSDQNRSFGFFDSESKSMSDFLRKLKYNLTTGQLHSKLCENRFMCEMGLLNANRKKNRESIRSLYKGLYNNFNEDSQNTNSDVNAVLKSIQERNCEIFVCNLD